MTRAQSRLMRFASDVLKANMTVTYKGYNDCHDDKDMLHREGKWTMVATQLHTIVGHQGWKSVIRHDCETVGSPYWMLLEWHTTPTMCVYCKEDMPDGIVGLFKLLNGDVMR